MLNNKAIAMKDTWLVTGLIFSSIGNFMLSLFVLSFSHSKIAFSNFAISFTFYTIMLSFYRPIICDALLNKDIYRTSNCREFLRDALIVSLVFSLIGLIPYLFISQLNSISFLVMTVSLPILLLHDAVRYKLLSLNFNRSAALLDLVWTSSFLVIAVIMLMVGTDSALNFQIAWSIPTLMTSIYGARVLLVFEPSSWNESWLTTTRSTWTINLKDFLLGQGVIQTIYFIAIAFVDPDKIASHRIAITILFPLTLLLSASTLRFFNFSQLGPSDSGTLFLPEKTDVIQRLKLRFALFYSFFAVLIGDVIVKLLTSNRTNFDRGILALCSILILIAIPQADRLNILKKQNQYREIVKIKKILLPFLLFSSIVLGALLNFVGLLLAMIGYQLLLSFKLSRIPQKASRDQRIGVVCEFESRDAFLAAKNQFESYSKSWLNPVIYCPKEVENCSLVKIDLVGDGQIQFLEFPSSIFSISQVVRFLCDFRRSWIRTGKPQLFAHGIRSGYLVSLSTFTRPIILIHRSLDHGISFLTRSFLRFHGIYCSKLMSVSPVRGNSRDIVFYPILSPFLNEQPNSEYSRDRQLSLPLRILWMARLDYPRLPELLLLALKNVPRSSYKCRMIGIGPKKSICQQIVLEFNLNVEFIDQTSPIMELEQSDLVVHMSEFEGMPFVLQEALALNVPVITSRLPGIEFLGGEAFRYVANEIELSREIIRSLNSRCLDKYSKLSKERWSEKRTEFNADWKLPSKYISGKNSV